MIRLQLYLPAKPPLARTAFTLVELLVVIAIIGILVTLTVTAIAPSLENSKVTATRALIAQIDGQLQRRLAAFNAMDQELEKTANYLFHSSLNSSNRATMTQAIAEVAVRKNRYLQEFPQRLLDLYGMDFQSGTMEGVSPVQVTRDSPLVATLNEINPPPTSISSSELLYLLLTKGRTLGNESYETDQINTKYLVDSDKDGLMEIVDAWGNELRFYNAPTALFRPADPSSTLSPVDLTKGARVLFHTIPGDDKSPSPSSAELYVDPFDKTGKLQTLSFNWSLNGTAMPPVSAENYYYPSTFFSFLIVSAGPDGDLGLHEPDETGFARLAQPVSLDQINDNLSNHQRK